MNFQASAKGVLWRKLFGFFFRQALAGVNFLVVRVCAGPGGVWEVGNGFGLYAVGERDAETKKSPASNGAGDIHPLNNQVAHTICRPGY